MATQGDDLYPMFRPNSVCNGSQFHSVHWDPRRNGSHFLSIHSHIERRGIKRREHNTESSELLKFNDRSIFIIHIPPSAPRREEQTRKNAKNSLAGRRRVWLRNAAGAMGKYRGTGCTLYKYTVSLWMGPTLNGTHSEWDPLRRRFSSFRALTSHHLPPRAQPLHKWYSIRPFLPILSDFCTRPAHILRTDVGARISGVVCLWPQFSELYSHRKRWNAHWLISTAKSEFVIFLPTLSCLSLFSLACLSFHSRDAHTAETTRRGVVGFPIDFRTVGLSSKLCMNKHRRFLSPPPLFDLFFLCFFFRSLFGCVQKSESSVGFCDCRRKKQAALEFCFRIFLTWTSRDGSEWVSECGTREVRCRFNCVYSAGKHFFPSICQNLPSTKTIFSVVFFPAQF